MKPQEIRDMNPDEIQRKIKELSANLFKLNVKLHTKQLEKTGQIRVMRKDIARLHTILKQKTGAAKEARVK